MKPVLTLVMLAAALAVTGCQNNKQTQRMPEAPPPMVGPYDGSSGLDQTVTVLPPVSEPSFTQPVTPAPPPVDVFEPQTVMEIPVEAPSQHTHVVQKGETLWSIARRYYGNGSRWQDIAQANNIADPGKLAVGKKLIIP